MKSARRADFAAFRSPVRGERGFSRPELSGVAAAGRDQRKDLLSRRHALRGGGERDGSRPRAPFRSGRRPPQITADGCCLLVGIEYNGKLGGDIAFLNWDVVDVANVPVRVAVTFEADAARRLPSRRDADDGRKGSD